MAMIFRFLRMGQRFHNHSSVCIPWIPNVHEPLNKPGYIVKVVKNGTGRPINMIYAEPAAISSISYKDDGVISRKYSGPIPQSMYSSRYDHYTRAQMHFMLTLVARHNKNVIASYTMAFDDARTFVILFYKHGEIDRINFRMQRVL